MLCRSLLVFFGIVASFHSLLAQQVSKVISIDGQRRYAMVLAGEKTALSYFHIDRGDSTLRVVVTDGADTVRYRFIDSHGDTLRLRLQYPRVQYQEYLRRYEMFASDDGADSLGVRMPALKGSLEPRLLINALDSVHVVMRNGEIRSDGLLAITRDTMYLAGGTFNPYQPQGAVVGCLAVADVAYIVGRNYESTDSVAYIPVHGDLRRLLFAIRDLCSVEPLYTLTTLPEITRDVLVAFDAADTLAAPIVMPLQQRSVVRAMPFVVVGQAGTEAPRMTMREVVRNREVRAETTQQADSSVIGGGVQGRYAVPLNETFDVVGGLNMGVVYTDVSHATWNARSSTSLFVDLLGGIALVLPRFDEAGYGRFSCSIGLCAGIELFHYSYTARANPLLYNSVGNDATINVTATTVAVRPIVQVEVMPSFRLHRRWALTLLAFARYTPITTKSMQVQYQGATGVFQMNVDYPTGVALLAGGGIGVSYAL